MNAEYLLKYSALIITHRRGTQGLMAIRTKKSVATLVIAVVLLNLIASNVKITYSESNNGKIDLFTQKIPFNGDGPNQPSDTFQPQELVILYALVTYNEYPVANKLVGFQVKNPANEFQNMTIFSTSFTNETGVALFSFRIPWPAENAEEIIFGEWFAIATVDIAGNIAIDTLSFQVSWIIKITKIFTLNELLQPITKCARGEKVIFNLTIENLALASKIATITVDLQDKLSYPILHAQKDDVFEPGKSYTYILSQIPFDATIGEANIYVVAYTASPEMGGVPYCPAISSKLIISARTQFYLAVKTDPPDVVAIAGEGWYDEGFNVILHAPKYIVITSSSRFEFSHWDVDGRQNTSSLITVTMNSNHTATAHYILQYYLDVGVVPSGIVTIPGEGWYNEFENVTLTAPHVEGYTFSDWNIDGVFQKSQTNTITIFMDAPHTAIAHYRVQGAAQYFPWWSLFWYLFIPLLLALLILFALLYRRKRKKKEETFYRGWTAWYYQYNILKRKLT